MQLSQSYGVCYVEYWEQINANAFHSIWYNNMGINAVEL